MSKPVSRAGITVSAALMGAGFIVFMVANAYHPSGIDPNNHQLVFAQYAQSAGWTADHLGYFVYMTLIISGFLVLIDSMNFSDGVALTVARLGIVFGGGALALSAVRYAVDGVVLKRAVDAWVNAPAGDQAARFASAEIARWMEEASASYQSFLLGFTLAVIAGLILWTARVPRPLGALFGIAAACYFVVGWILGESGFDLSGAAPTFAFQFLPPIAAAYLLVVAWRMPRAAAPRPAPAVAS